MPRLNGRYNCRTKFHWMHQQQQPHSKQYILNHQDDHLVIEEGRPLMESLPLVLTSCHVRGNCNFHVPPNIHHDDQTVFGCKNHDPYINPNKKGHPSSCTLIRKLLYEECHEAFLDPEEKQKQKSMIDDLVSSKSVGMSVDLYRYWRNNLFCMPFKRVALERMFKEYVMSFINTSAYDQCV